MSAQFLLIAAVPASPAAARTQVKESGSTSLSAAAGATLANRAIRVPDGSALVLYGDSKELREALEQAVSDGISSVCSDTGQPMDKHFVRFDFTVTNATLIVLAAPNFWGGQPAAPWTDVGGAPADTFFTQLMPGAMPPVLRVTIPDIVDHAKANHDNALANAW